MDWTLISGISHCYPAVSPEIPATTVSDVAKRCHLSLSSIYSKFQKDIEHINSDLVPDLSSIITRQRSMVTVADVTSKTTYSTPSRLNSLISLEKQNRETISQVHDLIKDVPEWASAPQVVHDSPSLCATTLEKQWMDLALIYLLSRPQMLNNSGVKCQSRILIYQRQCLSKRLDVWKQKLAVSQEEDCYITEPSDWSSTQPSAGMMTPLEGWSDVNSETTERAPEDAAPIEYLELINAAEQTVEFTRYLGALMKVNSRNRDRFVGILGENCAEATGILHNRYSHLVNNLAKLLHVPQQEPSLEHVPSVLGSPLASSTPDQAAHLQSVSNCHEDRSLEAIFSEIGPEVTDEDVARLIRHWST